ncbi:MAG: LLM class flavin-dependent oxidoreductase [Nitrososphaerota archaeon]|nr:LLM class flavin-dependent oxidoreductase [Nitrososphaerota archaeon]
MPRKSKFGSSTFEVAVDIGENEVDPENFKECTILAEKLGYDIVWLGDHFMPWVHSGNKSAFVWSLMGSCLEATRKIKLGPYVTTPIGARYHPAILAQASATLDNMYPGRFLLGVGTGEAINEVPFFERWPGWQERMERLVEGTQLMRKMWSSDSYFDFEGKYFKQKQVFLYTKPKTSLEIFFSAVGIKAAKFAGQYGDGLVTLSSHNTIEGFRDVLFPSFYEGAKNAGKNPDKMKIGLSLSFTLLDPKTFSRTERTYAGISAKGSWNVADPRIIEQMGKDMSEEDLFKTTHFCEKWSDVVDLIAKYREIGVTQIVLQPGTDKKLIRMYAQKILPNFKKSKR